MAHRAAHWSRRLLLLTMPLLAALGAPLPAAAAATGPAAPALRLVSSATTGTFARAIVPPLQQGYALNVTLSVAGSETGLDELRAGRADAVLISRPLSPREEREFTATPVAIDSLLLIVNERNPLDTADDNLIRRIFARQLSDWHQVGAGNSGAIIPVTRRAAYGTRTLFDNTFNIGRVIPSGIVELASNLATVLYVGADPQAIGYVSATAFDDARLHGVRIKVVKLNGQAPAAEGCRQSNYPLCRTIALVRRHGTPPRGYDRLELFLRDDDGAQLFERHGFAPLPLPPAAARDGATKR